MTSCSTSSLTSSSSSPVPTQKNTCHHHHRLTTLIIKRETAAQTAAFCTEQGWAAQPHSRSSKGTPPTCAAGAGWGDTSKRQGWSTIGGGGDTMGCVGARDPRASMVVKQEDASWDSRARSRFGQGCDKELTFCFLEIPLGSFKERRSPREAQDSGILITWTGGGVWIKRWH